MENNPGTNPAGDSAPSIPEPPTLRSSPSEGTVVEAQSPVRLCCFHRHKGVVCPDGLVMCCMCFERVARVDLALIDGEIFDMCKKCAEIEEKAQKRRKNA